MISPPELVCVNAVANDRHGWASEHGLVSTPVEATNVRFACPQVTVDTASAVRVKPAKTVRRMIESFIAASRGFSMARTAVLTAPTALLRRFGTAENGRRS